MIERFSEAAALLANNLRLFTAIILTVWLPGNILLHFVSHHFDDFGVREAIRLSAGIKGIFSPIYIGAMIHALYQLKSGQTVTYRQAIAVGFRKWGSLFAARLQADFFIFLGSLLIIPGLMLAVRYSLLDAAVIVDRREGSDALKRSVRLTEGLRWQIFFSALLFFPAYVILSAGLDMPLEFVEFDTMPIEIALDCFLDVAYAVIQIVMFLFYWEATRGGREAKPGDTLQDGAAGELSLPIPSGADDNPYRSPLSG